MGSILASVHLKRHTLRPELICLPTFSRHRINRLRSLREVFGRLPSHTVPADSVLARPLRPPVGRARVAFNSIVSEGRLVGTTCAQKHDGPRSWQARRRAPDVQTEVVSEEVSPRAHFKGGCTKYVFSRVYSPSYVLLCSSLHTRTAR